MSLGDCVDRRAQHLHALNVGRLSIDVNRAHVHVTRHPEERGDSRRRDAMHPRASLCDEPPLAHAPREQRLSDGVVHLVCAGVVEVLALQGYRRAAELR